MTNDAAQIERFDPSLDGLLNCVVREVPGWRLGRSGSGRADAFDLELPGRGLMLRARLRHHSPVGYHAFEPPLLLGAPQRLRSAGALACLALLIEEAELVGPTSPVGRERFLARLAESRRNVQAAMLARTDDLERLFAGSLDFIGAEQALLTGHPSHPAPKSYDEFGCDDAIAYAPEFAAAFPLHWHLVERRALDAGGTPDHPPADAVQALFQSDPALPATLKRRVREQSPDWLPLPMHPWQASRLREREPLARLLAEGLAEDLGRIGSPFRPTTSLRTLHADHAPYMLKFSLSVRVTNSKRLMEPKEWRRGKQMHQLLTGPFAAVLEDEASGLHVLGEPVHLALHDEGGRAAESAVARQPFSRCWLAGCHRPGLALPGAPLWRPLAHRLASRPPRGAHGHRARSRRSALARPLPRGGDGAVPAARGRARPAAQRPWPEPAAAARGRSAGGRLVPRLPERRIRPCPRRPSAPLAAGAGAGRVERRGADARP